MWPTNHGYLIIIINSSSSISHYKGYCEPLVSCCNHRKPILLNSHNLNKALYVIIFLMIYNFRGHCLMGQLHELTGHLEKAVSSYRRYLSKYGKKVTNFIRKLQCQIKLYCTSRLDFGFVGVGNKKLLLLQYVEVIRNWKVHKFEIHLKDEQNSGASTFCITKLYLERQ